MAKQPQAINSYDPAKGIKIAVTLKDGTEVTGNVTKASAASIQLDDETFSRRNITVIKFRGRVVAERAGRGTPKATAAAAAKPARGGRGRKKRISRRTSTGRPAAPRGRKKAASAGRGRRRTGNTSAPTPAPAGTAQVAVNGTSILVCSDRGEFNETLSIPVSESVVARLVELGVPQI